MSEPKNYAKNYLRQELNRLESQEKDAQEKVKKAEIELKNVQEKIADFKKALGN